MKQKLFATLNTMQYRPIGITQSECLVLRAQKIPDQCHSIISLFYKLEIRSTERGICPIVMLALHLTLYSLTGSRFDP